MRTRMSTYEDGVSLQVSELVRLRRLSSVRSEMEFDFTGIEIPACPSLNLVLGSIPFL